MKDEIKIQAAKVITYPNPNLSRVSRKVDVIDAGVKELIARLRATISKWEEDNNHSISVGIAAIQIDEPTAVVLVRDDFEHHENGSFHVLINPEIVKYEGIPIVQMEGCMSVDCVYGRVPRYPKVRVRAMDEQGKMIEFSARDYHARVLQHEVDHTNGLLFLNRALNPADHPFKELTRKGNLVPITAEGLKDKYQIELNG